ncbi:MAG: cytochrome c [Magnetococcus sp. WYHC-3]
MAISMRVLLSAAVLGAGLLSAHSAQAVSGAEADALVKTRQGLMSGIGGAMGALGCWSKGECDGLEAKVTKRLAEGIAAMTAPSIEAYRQPTMELSIKTTATADVWSQWSKFEEGMKMMGSSASALAKAIEGGDSGAIKSAMGDLGKTCKGCHDTFREKPKH